MDNCWFANSSAELSSGIAILDELGNYVREEKKRRLVRVLLKVSTLPLYHGCNSAFFSRQILDAAKWTNTLSKTIKILKFIWQARRAIVVARDVVSMYAFSIMRTTKLSTFDAFAIVVVRRSAFKYELKKYSWKFNASTGVKQNNAVHFHRL